MSAFAAGQTGLVVASPSAEPVVARLRAAYDLAGIATSVPATEPGLPFAARADRLHLIAFDGTRWQSAGHWPLG